jgi:hypothetical protein
MKFSNLIKFGAASALLTLFVSCQDAGSKNTSPADESSVMRAGDNTPETVTPGKFYCSAKRLDGAHAGKPWLGGGNTGVEACKKAVEMCNRVTGAASAEVGGEGACIASTPIDRYATGIGQVTDEGRGYFVCPVAEFYNSTAPIDRAFAGIGKTLAEAKADAQEKCEYRGGFNCNRVLQCFDGSVSSVQPE